MPHGGPHQTTTTFNKPKTDTRPKGMPSFLSYSKPKPKPKPFSQMTHQERTERFNKNQDKYKKQFEKKEGTIREKSQNNRYYADRYGYYQIPDGSKPKTKKQKSLEDRKLYRQYQDPKVLEATERAKIESGGFIQDVADIPVNMYKNYMNRVTNVNKHFSNLLNNAKKEYISPEEPYWQRMLKERALTEWYGTGQLLAGTMEGALGLTLDTAAGYTASTLANFNDIYRALQGLPLDAEIHNNITEDLQEHIVGATMAAWESTGYGAMKMPKYPIPKMTTTANFIAKKIPFEFKNTIKVFNNAVKQKKAKNMTIEGDWKIMTEAATKNTAVKKEIKQLAIQSWEQANVINYGPIMANNIANHLRQVNDIMPVQAQSVGAAATPKTDIYKLGEPFYNPIVQQVNSLPVNEAGQIQVKNLTESLSTKKFERPMVISNFNTFLSNLKESNVTMVDKKTVDNYLKDNPIELTIDIGQRNVPIELIEEKGVIRQNLIGGAMELQNTTSAVSQNLPKSMTVADIPVNMVLEFGSSPGSGLLGGNVFNTGYLNEAHATTGSRLIEEITNNQIKKIIENEYYSPDTLTDFYNGSINLLTSIPEDGFFVRVGGKAEFFNDMKVIPGFKDKIMYALGYAPHYSGTTYSPIKKPSGYGELNTHYVPVKKPAELNAVGEQWVQTLLSNFNNRKHFDYDLQDYVSYVPMLKVTTDGVTNYKNLTIDTLKELANPKNTLDNDGLIDLEFNARLTNPNLENSTVYNYQTNQQLLETALDRIVYGLDLRDLPGWKDYINTLTGEPDLSATSTLSPIEKRMYVAQRTTGMRTWETSIMNMTKASENLAQINKKIEMAEKEAIVNKRPYVSSDLAKQNYEKGQITFKEHPHDNYMEVKLTSNNLSGYPDFKDSHFDTDQLLGWSLVTTRRINIDSTNPKGDRAYVIEEIQPTDPKSFTVDGEKEGTFLFGSMTKEGLGKPDWYKKKLWADIRVAYDNGFDYVIIPTTKSIKSKSGSGGFYDELPNVAKKFGFTTIKNANMVDYGFTAPESVIEQRLRDAEDIQTGAEQVGDDFGPYGRDEINYEYLNEMYNDHRFHIIDIRDRDKVFDILNKPQPVAKLIDQTNQMLSTFA